MRSIKTPVGDLQISFQATGSQSDAEAVSNCIHVASFSPRIPSGMSISGCFVAVAMITPKEPLRNILFQARLSSSGKIESGTETGEGLEAQGFYSDKHVLLVGTEDADFLKARVNGIVQLPEDPYAYTDNSISIQVLEVAAGETLSLHFVAAWNDLPEPQDCSCWFAVDQGHAAILAAVNRG